MTLTPVPVQLVNKAADTRTRMFTLGILLRPGELTNRATQLMISDGSSQDRVQWQPFHDTRHPDGSFMEIAAHFPVSMAPGGELQATITEGVSTNQIPFALHPAVVALLGSTFALTVEGETMQIALSDVMNQAISTSAFAGGRIGGEHENTHIHRHVFRLRWQSPTNTRLRAIWQEIAFEAPSGMTRAKWTYSWGYSWCQSGVRLGNPWNDKTMVLTQPVTLRVTGPGAYFIGENKKCNSITRVGNVTTFTLIDPDRFRPPHTGYDFRHRNLTQGMRHTLSGELLFGGEPIPTNDLDREGVSGMAMDWPEKGMPPFGIIPAYPAYMPNRAEAITRLREWELDLYGKGRDADPYFCTGTVGNASTSNTGDAGIYFGTMRLWITLRSGYPGGLGVLLRDIRQEFCRPNNNCYPGYDATTWRFADFRPATGLQLMMFNGVPFHLGEANRSPEMFGVNGPIGQLGIQFDPDCPQSEVNGAWGAWDRQHAMLMVEATVALITADYSVLALFENLEQVWYGNCDIDNPNELINENEESRAFARGIVRTGLDIWRIRGTQRILDILRTRTNYAIFGTPAGGIAKAYQHSPQRVGTSFPITMGSFTDRDPDIQAGSLETVQHGYPWNDAQVAGSCDALCALLTERYGATDQVAQFARHISDDMALQVTLYGWIDARGLAPDRYRAIMTNVPSNVMSQAGIRELIAGRTVTGGTSGSTAVVVSYFETDGNAALWVRDAVGTFGEETLTFAGSAFTCNAVNELGGFIAAKARENTADFHPLSKAELETTATFNLFQPRAPGQFQAILSCTKEVNPLIRLVPPGNPHYLVASSRLLISGDPWPALNGEWGITIVDDETVRLVGCNTTAMPGTYTPSEATQVNRRLWGSRSIKLYKGYGIWQLQAAIVARDAANRGVYGPLTAGTVGARALARAQDIINDFGVNLEADVPVTPLPRWREIPEHAALRANPFSTSPTPPTGLQARGVGPTTVRVNWINSWAGVFTDIRYRQVNSEPWTDAPSTARDASQADVGGLATRTAYEFQIRSRTETWTSPWVGPVTASTQGNPPVTVANLAATGPTSTSIVATWANPATNADTTEVQYRRVGDATWIDVAPPLLPTVLTVTLPGLLQGTSYEVRVRNVNTAGPSVWAGPVTAQTRVGAPTAPTGLTATPFSSTQINLAWTNPAGTVTGTEVQYQLATETVWHAGPTLDPSEVSLEYVLPFAPATTYRFRIRAVNGSGPSDWAGPVTATTNGVAPSAPNGLAGMGDSGTTVTFAWQNTATNATSIETHYKVHGAGSWTPGPTLGPTQVNLSLGVLLAGTQYDFELRAVNSWGASAWVAGSATTLSGTPTAPTSLLASAASSSSVNLSWTNTSGLATRNEVQFRAVGAASWRVGPTVAGSATTATVSNLVPGTPLEFQVRAANGSGSSAWSSSAFATTPPGPPAEISPDAPTNLRLFPVGSTEIDVSWTTVATNALGHEVQYREYHTENWLPAGNVPIAKASLEVTEGIEAGKVYEFRVRAYHATGRSDWLGPKSQQAGMETALSAADWVGLLLEAISDRIGDRVRPEITIGQRSLTTEPLSELKRLLERGYARQAEFKSAVGTTWMRLERTR